MELVARKLKVDTLTREEFLQFADIERAGRLSYEDGEVLLRWISEGDVYALFDGTRMAAYAVIEQGRYFGGSVHIAALRPDWEYNSDDVLETLLRSALSRYRNRQFVTVDCDRRYDPCRELYRKLGFADCLQESRLGRKYVVMLAMASRFTTA